MPSTAVAAPPRPARTPRRADLEIRGRPFRQLAVSILPRLRAYARFAPAVPVLLYVLLTAFAIHGSSFAVYETYLGVDPKQDPNLLYGQVRPIRSDEYLVVSPLAVGQERVGFRTVNSNIGLGENVAVLTETPAWSWKALFEPGTWPYFVLPLKNAFAASWWLSDLLLLIGAYLVIMVLTGGSQLLSVGIPIALLYAPFVQWWRGAALTAPAFGLLLLYFAFQVLIRQSTRARLLCGLLVGYFAACFFFVLYPPFQVPIAILVLCLFAGYALRERRSWMATRPFWIVAAFATGGFILLAAAGAYYLSFRAQIHLVTNTAYPGKRVETGGNYSWLQFFNGFFNLQLLDDTNGVGPFANQSEASNFLMLFPFVVPLYLFGTVRRWRKGEKPDAVLTALVVCLVFLTLWVLVGWPGIVARVTLLSLVPASRTLVGIGVADLVFVALFIVRSTRERGRTYRVIGGCAALAAFGVQLHLGLVLMSQYSPFIRDTVRVVLVALVAAACVLLANWGMKRSFVAVLVAYTLLMTNSVNPLYRGLYPLVGTRFARAIQSIVHQDRGRHRWAVYGSLAWGEYIIANGGDSLSTVYLYPQLDLWRRFDPRGQYSAVYNRYAHVEFSVPTAGADTFTLLQPDVFSVNVNPCDPILRALHVRFFVFGGRVAFPCLRLEAGDVSPGRTVFLYRRTV